MQTTLILTEDEKGINNALAAMEIYCDTWKLDINCIYTKITVFAKIKDSVRNFNFKFKGEQIEIVDEYKYLGVTLRCNGGFEVCQEILCQQGRRTMCSLIAKCRKFNLPVDLQLELFDTMLLPVLMYGCKIWGYKIHKAIEVVHLTFLKHILGVKKTTCNHMVYGKLDKYSFNIHSKSRMSSYWLRVIIGKQDKISYIMYQCLLKLHNENTFKPPFLK